MIRISVCLVCILATTIAIWSGCQKEAPTNIESALSVTGIVIDSVTGIALDSVSIAIKDSTQILTYSDSSGHYKFTMWGTSAIVYAIKEGYITKSSLAHGSSGSTTVIDFQLAPE